MKSVKGDAFPFIVLIIALFILAFMGVHAQVKRNQLIEDHNTTAVTLYIVAGCSVVAGLLLLLWPDGAPEPSLLVSEDQAILTIGGEF